MADSEAQSLTQTLYHPAVWRGEELWGREDWEYWLTEEDLGEIRRALAVSGESGRETEALTRAEFPLPGLGERLLKIQDALENGSGAVMVRGFPAREFSEAEARRVFWGLSIYVGTPMSQSAAGEKIFSVRNEGFADNDPRSRGPNTKKKLSFHTDRCDVIGFLCWRKARSGGENELVSSMSLYNEIGRRRPDLLAQLMEPYLYKRHTVDTANPLPYCRQPVFSFEQGHFACSFLRVLIERAYAEPDSPEEMTPLQKEALDFLEAVAGEPEMHVRFMQEPGDILFLNNWVTLHRRSEFEDHEDLAERRHLFRLWLSVPNSRPISPLFRENFGAVEAGAPRGGMKAAGG